jgi:hypothetical protein
VKRCARIAVEWFFVPTLRGASRLVVFQSVMGRHKVGGGTTKRSDPSSSCRSLLLLLLLLLLVISRSLSFPFLSLPFSPSTSHDILNADPAAWPSQACASAPALAAFACACAASSARV